MPRAFNTVLPPIPMASHWRSASGTEPGHVQPVVDGTDDDERRVNGTVQGKALPLVVMSHGTGGSSSVISTRPLRWPTPVSSWRPSPTRATTMQTRAAASTSWTGRRQISRVIDHMLSTWDGHATIDPQRVGMFGFSAADSPRWRASVAFLISQRSVRCAASTPETSHASSSQRAAAIPRSPHARHSPCGRSSHQGRSGGRTRAWIHVLTGRAQERQGARATLARRKRCHSFRTRAMQKLCGSRCRRRRTITSFRMPDISTSWCLAAMRWLDRARHLHQCGRLRSGGVSCWLRFRISEVL